MLRNVASHRIGNEIPDAGSARELRAHERRRAVEGGQVEDAQLGALRRFEGFEQSIVALGVALGARSDREEHEMFEYRLESLPG